MSTKRGTGKRQDSRKRGGPPWVLLSVFFFGILLVGGVGIGAWVLYLRLGPSALGGGAPGGGALNEELRYAPDELSSLEIRRLDQIVADPDYQRFEAEFPHLIGSPERDKMANVPAAEVERATVAQGKGGEITILRMKKPVTADLIKQWDGRGAWIAPENVGGYTLHAVLGGPAEGEHNNSSFCVPSSKVVLLGFARDLRKVLRRGGKATAPPQLELGLKLVDLYRHLVKIEVCEGRNVQLGNDNCMSPKTLIATRKPAVVVKTCQTQIGRNLDSTVIYLCTDEAAAQSLRPVIEDATRQTAEQYKAGAFEFANQSVTVEGNVVTVRDRYALADYVTWLKVINKR